ncbi:MAG: hypothetical protein Q9184_002836 [Pyrenodesmia sp. 2 TL-2023]
MATETRGPKASGQPSGSPDPSSSARKTYDTFNYPATAENVNSLPGSNGSKVGKQQPMNAGYIDAVKSIRLADFTEVHRKPCTREGFLMGIGAGFGVGGVRAILGGKESGTPAHFCDMLTAVAPVFTACSWAVGAFVFGSFAMHEYCQQKRRMEKAGIQRINAALDEKKVELERKREEARKARRKAKEETDRQKGN